MAKATQRKVLASGSARLESVLDFVAFAAKPMPLLTLLDEAPKRIAAIVEAQICSLYALEGEGELVMRGNIGFPRSAIGQVRLAVGEGLTGEAVEYMRPVVAELAKKHASYKHFEELGEDRFPVFLAALIAAGIRTAELLDAQRDKAPVRKAGGGTRKVTLPGRPVVPGRALGAVAALRRPPQRPSARVPGAAGKQAEGDADVRLLKSAFDVGEKAIRGLVARAVELELGSAAGFLATYLEILTDTRFRQRSMEYAGDGRGVAQALSAVARDVTRTAVQMTRDPFMDERARDIEDLCDALSMLAASDKRAELPQRSILVGDALTVFDLLVSSRARPVGVALTERAGGPRSRILLELLGVPALMDVQGLFRWASDGDVALIDADHGLLMINPSKAEVAALREHRRSAAKELGLEEEV